MFNQLSDIVNHTVSANKVFPKFQQKKYLEGKEVHKRIDKYEITVKN